MRSNSMIMLLMIIAPFICSFSFLKSQPRDYADIARDIRANVGKKLSKKHQMDLIGEGGGMMGSVYMIGLSFQIRHPLNRNEARARIVDCTEELLAAINSSEEIRPFLKNYPFTPENLELAIFSVSPKGEKLYDPNIAVVSVDQSNYITFRTEEPNNVSYKHRHKELYSEAVKMLKTKLECKKE